MSGTPNFTYSFTCKQRLPLNYFKYETPSGFQKKEEELEQKHGYFEKLPRFFKTTDFSDLLVYTII
jgi:hypothetical protein